MNKMWHLQTTTYRRVPSAVECTPLQNFLPAVNNKLPQPQYIHANRLLRKFVAGFSSVVFIYRRVAARYRALASIIPGRERPEENTVCYKISLVHLIDN